MFDFDVRSGSHARENSWIEGAARLRPREHELAVPVSVIPRRPPLSVPPTCTLSEALQLMFERQVGVVLVASHDVLLGSLSERDLMHHLLDKSVELGDVPVAEVMVSEVETLLESDTVAYAFRKMWSLGGRAMPVLLGDGSLDGVLETRDLIAWLCGRVGTRLRSPTRPF